MRAMIVYESFSGSTRAVAEAVADGVRAAAPSADVTTCEVAAATADLDRVDLLVVGAPTHALGRASRVSRWLQAQFWGDPVAPTRRHRPYGRPSSRRPLRAWLSRLPPHPGLARRRLRHPHPRPAVRQRREGGPRPGSADAVWCSSREPKASRCRGSAAHRQTVSWPEHPSGVPHWCAP